MQLYNVYNVSLCLYYALQGRVKTEVPGQMLPRNYQFFLHFIVSKGDIVHSNHNNNKMASKGDLFIISLPWIPLR